MTPEPSIEELATLLRNFDRLRGLMPGAALSDVQQALRTLWQGVEPLLVQGKEQERISASKHNVFRLLGVERDEQRTHSAMLADLLDPNGTHGQGPLFLLEFLNQCSKIPGVPGLHGDLGRARWFVETEKAMREGRMDIVVSCPDLGWLLVVENKIDAGEQAQQIRRYFTWMESQKVHYPRRALLFLTPDGRPATDAEGCTYFSLSYRQDIREVIGRAVPRIVAPGLRATLSQYVDIFEDTMNEKGYEKQIVDFLLTPENFRLALELMKWTEKARFRVQAGFMKDLYAALETWLRDSPWRNKWILELEDDKKLCDDYYGIYLSPKGADDFPNNQKYLYYSITQGDERGHFLFYYRLGWSDDTTPKNLPAGGFGTLVPLLRDRGFKSTGWSLGWKAIATFADQNDYLVALTSRTKELADQAIEQFSRFFEDTAAAAEKANAALEGRS